MAPGDSWSQLEGFNIHDTDWYTDFNAKLLSYLESKKSILAQNRRKEGEVRLSDEVMIEYVTRLTESIPKLMRRIMKGKNITSFATAGMSKIFLMIFRGSVRRLDKVTDEENPIQVVTSSYIVQECIAKHNWASLGISKRVKWRMRRKDVKFLRIFEFLCNALDFEILPMSNLLEWRFLSVWFSRWREILLYIRIAGEISVRRRFEYRRYL